MAVGGVKLGELGSGRAEELGGVKNKMLAVGVVKRINDWQWEG